MRCRGPSAGPRCRRFRGRLSTRFAAATSSKSASSEGRRGRAYTTPAILALGATHGGADARGPADAAAVDSCLYAGGDRAGTHTVDGRSAGGRGRDRSCTTASPTRSAAQPSSKSGSPSCCQKTIREIGSLGYQVDSPRHRQGMHDDARDCRPDAGDFRPCLGCSRRCSQRLEYDDRPLLSLIADESRARRRRSAIVSSASRSGPFTSPLSMTSRISTSSCGIE